MGSNNSSRFLSRETIDQLALAVACAPLQTLHIGAVPASCWPEYKDSAGLVLAVLLTDEFCEPHSVVLFSTSRLHPAQKRATSAAWAERQARLWLNLRLPSEVFASGEEDGVLAIKLPQAKNKAAKRKAAAADEPAHALSS